MSEVDQINAEKTAETNDRRAFLGKMTAAGMGLGLLGLGSTVGAASMKMGLTEKDFRMGVIGPATLSRIASQLAVLRATQPDTREFARFELREAIAVTTVLRELQTPTPPMNAKAKATLAMIQAAAPGRDFDVAYITAQHDNHIFLMNLATAYLQNTTPSEPTFPEQQGRHLATLALNQFTEHVELTARILSELQQG